VKLSKWGQYPPFNPIQVVWLKTIRKCRPKPSEQPIKIMKLTKARKAYLVVDKGKNTAQATGRLFSAIGHLRNAYDTNKEYFSKHYDVIEFDIVEAGTVKGEDFEAVFPRKK
jgi:hypothetical protein